jgi:peptidoglycan/xylan/chitin deacetylase (PgdA/CDA1 family)
MKYAVLSMDIEDWYHLDYLSGKACDRTYSMLDGLDAYQQLIESHRICSSYFVLGEVVQSLKKALRQMSERGYDIGTHGWGHVRPLRLDLQTFESEVQSCKHELEDVLGKPVLGYRAPCFSLDRERLDVLAKVGFKYDSSRILFGEHPLYGELDVAGFQERLPGVYCYGEFFEFEISTVPFFGKRIPVSGGGYLRIFPWAAMKMLLNRYLAHQDLYVLYIHPFETSSRPNPVMPRGTSRASQFRFSLGRGSVFTKLGALITMLKAHGFEFTTFSALRERVLQVPQA